MLFDLRSPGRRRVVKTVYLFLAVLIGVGLIGFGVGTGGNFGGLFNAAGSGGANATGNVTYEKALTRAEKRAKENPNSAAAWLKAGLAAYAVAVLPSNFVSTKGYSSAGHTALGKVKQAWQRYVALAPSKPSTLFAQDVVAGFGPPPPSGTGIGDYATAESAQEIITEDQPTYVNYEYLAYYAYLGKNITAGDLAAAKAIRLAPKKQRKNTKTALQALRLQAVGSTGASGATGAGG
jgi:hypothetical protein